MKQNPKQNKVHDEQILVAKLRREKFKWYKESSTFMSKKNDFFVNCYGNKLMAMFPIYKWQSIKLVIDDTTAAPALYIVGQ